MKIIALNESQYKRLFEASETLLNLGNGDGSQNNLPHNIGKSQVSAAGSELTDKGNSHEFQEPFGGIKRNPDGKLGLHTFADNISNNGNLANRR